MSMHMRTHMSMHSRIQSGKAAGLGHFVSLIKSGVQVLPRRGDSIFGDFRGMPTANAEG